MIEAALIGAGANLLGGLFGRRSARKAQAEQNAYNDPSAMRARFEKAGFNPLLAPLGQSYQSAPMLTGQMGNAIANAGLFVANDMKDEQALKIEKSRLEMDRQKLDKLLQNATIRPKSGGIYSGNIRSPSVGGVGSAPLLTPPIRPDKYGPELSTITDPTGVMRDDGLPSANPDMPAEFEADLWERARKGEILPFGWELYKRNTMSKPQRERWDKTVTGAKTRLTTAKENLNSVFSQPRKKDARVPRLSLPSYLPSISN